MGTPIEHYAPNYMNLTGYAKTALELNNSNKLGRSIPNLKQLIKEYQYAIDNAQRWEPQKNFEDDTEAEIYAQTFDAGLQSQFVIWWDITTMKASLKEHEYQVTEIPATSVYNLLNQEMIDETEEDHIHSMSAKKLAEPILIVPVNSISMQNYMVVDGHHRAIKRYQDNANQMVQVIYVPEFISIESLCSEKDRDIYKFVSSMKSMIGYLKGSDDQYIIYRYNRPVGRNDPCPCGGGKKYKHCHINQRTYTERLP